VRAKAVVKIDDRFAEFGRDTERAVVRSLGEAAAVAIGAGRAKPSRYDIPNVQNQTKVLPPIRIPGGWLLAIVWTDFRAHWFDKGTYQKLGGRGARSRFGRQTKQWLASGPEGHEGNRGIKPINWTRTAKAAGVAALMRALARHIGG
jgi:hypothetical protein